jgi:hypothetical protein
VQVMNCDFGVMGDGSMVRLPVIEKM